ncbi:DNA topoisomerase VI subunit B [Candidatus Haloredivivus sp. G17]|nr:DNA topoisomerase VI subunit B [Candidatus Haloredivivus sp. G17]
MKGLKKELNPEFSTAITRSPTVYKGNPFQIEVGLAWGGDIEDEGSFDELRFANKVPLLYPTVWYLSETIYPAGPGIFGAFETSVAFVILPFFCKQAYGFLDMYLIHEAEEQM